MSAISRNLDTPKRRHARKLAELVDRPKYAGEEWSYDLIAAMLNITKSQAQSVVQWMRQNTNDMYWTIPSASTGYMFKRTLSRADALPGSVVELKQSHSRLRSQQRAFQVLKTVDPDPIARQDCAADEAKLGMLADLLEEHIEKRIAEMETIETAVDEAAA